MQRTDWSISRDSGDSINKTLSSFERYLAGRGIRESTIEGYSACLRRYLKCCGSDRPPISKVEEYRNELLDRHLSRSTLNNTGFALRQFYGMLGEPIEIPFLKANGHIPDYFREDEVQRIFGACHNLKHLAMLHTIFYGCLRASELCDLDDRDLVLKEMSVRVREGKGGRDGVVFIQEECARVLREYLERRPPLIVDNRRPLFYTDSGRRWDRKMLSAMFMKIKRRSGVERAGGLHVFGRHTPASLMIANGCDIRIVQKVLRHKSITTTVKYAHVNDETARRWYERCLRLGQ